MNDTRTEQNLGVLDHEDDEELEITNDDANWGAPPWFARQESGDQSTDEQRIVEVIEGRGAHEIHPGGPGVGGD